MAENSWPFEDTDTTETQWQKMFNLLAGTGTIDGLTLSSGGGMLVNVAAGSAFVRGFFYENTATLGLTVAAANTTPRKDYVVRRLDMNANKVTTLVLKGTANSSGGTLPALTQTATTWDVPVGIVTVPANAVNLVTANIANLSSFAQVSVIPYSGALADVIVYDYPAIAFDTGTGQLSFNSGTGGWKSSVAASSVDLLTGLSPLGKQLLTVADTTALQHLVGLWVQNTDPGVKPAGHVWMPEA